jgi:hypothetical protein
MGDSWLIFSILAELKRRSEMEQNKISRSDTETPTKVVPEENPTPYARAADALVPEFFNRGDVVVSKTSGRRFVVFGTAAGAVFGYELTALDPRDLTPSAGL